MLLGVIKYIHNCDYFGPILIWAGNHKVLTNFLTSLLNFFSSRDTGSSIVVER